MAEAGLQGIGHIPYEKDEYWEYCVDYLGYQCLTKSEVYERLGYKPLPTIEKMHRSRAIHRILVGGNRAGKTYGAMMEIIPYLFWIGTRGWVVSANYEMAEELRRKVEDILTERAGMERVLKSTDLSPWQFSYSLKNRLFTMGTGSWFQLKSAESPESMHAVPLDWIVVDEAALLPYILYDTRLVPRLADSGGWILSIGTFEWLRGEWFEEYFDIGQVENDLSIESWSHPTEDNYHVYTARGGETPEEVGAEYHKNWKRLVEENPDVEWPLRPGQQVIIWNIDFAWLEEQRKRVPPEIFAARYEAKRATSPYIVFPDWNIADFVDKDRASFDPELPVFLAVDPGGTYAVAACQFKKFPDVGQDNELTGGYSLCIIDEVYFQSTVTTHEVYDVVCNREWWSNVARWCYPHWPGMQGAIDVAAKEQARVWERLGHEDEIVRGLHLMRQKVQQQAGIQTLQHFLDTHSIFVHPRCTFWNLEMRRWTYPIPALQGVETEDPRKSEPKDAWNHLVKAVIYLIVNRYGYYGRSGSSAVVSRFDVRSRRKEAREGMMRAVVSRFKK